MVLSLVQLSLVKVRDGLEKGKIRDVHSLPPNLRQSILDMVLMHGTINNSNCSTALSSSTFLRGLESFDTQKGNVDDNDYLLRVADSLATIQSNGETIGANVVELKLNLYGRDRLRGPDTVDRNIGAVIRLIAQCPRLAVLNLRLVEEYKSGYDFLRDRLPPRCEDKKRSGIASLKIFDDKDNTGGLLNNVKGLAPCLSILENIQDLTLIGCRGSAQFLTHYRPIIRFKNLTSLHLAKCDLNGDRWLELLENIRETIIHLHLDIGQFNGLEDEEYYVLPFPFPNLKSLKVDNLSFHGAPDFFKNLKRCQKLEDVYFAIDAGQRVDEEILSAINRLKANVKIKVYCKTLDESYVKIDHDDLAIIQLADSLKEKITHFKFKAQAWDSKFADAVRRVASVCENLVSFDFITQTNFEDYDFYDGSDDESEEDGEDEDDYDAKVEKIKDEIQRAKSALVPLFASKDRASKLVKLSLYGEYDSGILDLVFRNCLNLDSLTVRGCPQLNDDHLIEWARRGAKVSTLKITYCENLSDDGLIAVIESCGTRLIHFGFLNHDDVDGVTNRMWRALFYHCPFVKRINIPPDLYNVADNKLYNNKLDLASVEHSG